MLVILYMLGALVSPVYAPTLALMGLAGLLAGYLEEIGWTGYATPRLLARCSPVTAGLWLGALWGVWHALANYAIRGNALGTFWPVTFGLFVLPLIAWRIVMTVVYARTQSGVVAQLMHLAYTGSLGAFIPLAAISPVQDALVYATLAGVSRLDPLLPAEQPIPRNSMQRLRLFSRARPARRSPLGKPLARPGSTTGRRSPPGCRRGAERGVQLPKGRGRFVPSQ